MNEYEVKLDNFNESTLVIAVDDDLHIASVNGQAVVSSRYVAERFSKRHSDVLEKIHKLTSEIDSTENSVQWFIPGTYADSSGKRNLEYLMNRDGFSLLTMGFTGKEALDWKMKYIKAFNLIEQKLSKQIISTEDAIIQSMQLQKQLKQDISHVDERVSLVEYKLNKQLTINSNGQRKIQKEVAKRVYQRLDVNEQFNNSFDKKSHARIFFASIHKEIKNRFGVSSYKDILVLEFDDAICYIKNWIEPTEIRGEINE